MSQFQGAAGDQMFKRGAVEELHDEEGASIVLADVVNRADVGMIQGGGGLWLRGETARGPGDPGRDHREGT